MFEMNEIKLLDTEHDIKHDRVHNDSNKEHFSDDVSSRYQCTHCEMKFTDETHLETHIHCHHKQTVSLLSSDNRTFNDNQGTENDIKIKDEWLNEEDNLFLLFNTNTAENIYDADIKIEENDLQDVTEEENCLNNSESTGESGVGGCHKKDTIKINMTGHTENKPYTCVVCDKKFLSPGSLEAHVRIHTGEKPYSCVICHKQFRLSGSLQSHMMTHRGVKHTGEKHTEEKHTGEKHTGEKPYSCVIGHKQFCLSRSLQSHMMTHTGVKPYTCIVCHKKFAALSSLKMHESVHTGEKPLSGGECEKTSSQYSPLEKPYSCDICHHRFRQSNHLQQHLRVHTGEKPFSCSECDQKFSQPGALKYHIMKFHVGEKPYYSCDICFRRFTRSSLFQIHMRRHTGEKPFSCSVCDKKFKDSYYLKYHMMLHTGTGVKPYTCKVCDKKFTSLGGLKMHKSIHTGEKPFSCVICHKQFRLSSSLQNHMMTHEGDKPNYYTCIVCKKKFGSLSSLQMHKSVHTGEKPLHKCSECDKIFSSSSDLQVHMGVHIGLPNDIRTTTRKQHYTMSGSNPAPPLSKSPPPSPPPLSSSVVTVTSSVVTLRPSPSVVPPRPSLTVVPLRPSPSVVPLRPSPTVVPLRPSPTVAPLRPSPTVARLRPSPSFVTLRPSPSVAPLRPSPSVVPLRPSPTVAPLRPSPSFVTLRPSPSVVQLRPSPTFAPLRPSPSVAPRRPSLLVVPLRPSPPVEPPRPSPSVVPLRPSPSVVPLQPSSSIASPSLVPSPEFMECEDSAPISQPASPMQQPPLRDDDNYNIINYGSDEDSDENNDEEEGIVNVIPRVFRSMLETPLDHGVDHSDHSDPAPADLADVHTTMMEQPSSICDFNWTEFPNPPIPPGSRRETFSQSNVGPTTRGDPYDIFVEIWDRQIMEHIAVETNRYAQQVASKMIANNTLQPNSRISRWQDTTVDELYVYFGLILAMGNVVKTRIEEYWASTPDIFYTPGFSAHMSIDRFLLLNKCIHFNNNDDICAELDYTEARLFKIRPILSHLNKKFQQMYIPAQNIALDESLLMWKGWLEFSQLIPNKAANRGLKSYEICESQTGYLWRFEVHAHKESLPQQPENPLEAFVPSIVLKLIQGLENKGYTLWMDSFYNSPCLARRLKCLGFDCVGTLRTDRKFVPRELNSLTKWNMRQGQITGLTSMDVDVMVWRDTNRVAMISTYHGNGQQTVRGSTKPTLILDYNIMMGGVDKKDQLLAMYPIERRTKVWYKKLFKKLLNVSVLNSYIIHKYTSSLSQRNFRNSLVKSLLSKHSAPSPIPPATKPDVTHRLAEFAMGKRQRMRRACSACKKQVRTFCVGCGKTVCIEPCFLSIHS